MRSPPHGQLPSMHSRSPSQKESPLQWPSLTVHLRSSQLSSFWQQSLSFSVCKPEQCCTNPAPSGSGQSQVRVFQTKTTKNTHQFREKVMAVTHWMHESIVAGSTIIPSSQQHLPDGWRIMLFGHTHFSQSAVSVATMGKVHVHISGVSIMQLGQ